MKQYIDKIKDKQNLSFNESKSAFKILMEGKANKIICKESVSQGVDLIVMGISEKKSITSFIFSSTASYVIDHVDIPVLVVPIKSN